MSDAVGSCTLDPCLSAVRPLSKADGAGLGAVAFVGCPVLYFFSRRRNSTLVVTEVCCEVGLQYTI